MADTIREQIIKAFTDRAQSLSGGAVERAKRAHVEEGVRNVSVWDGEDNGDDPQFGVQNLSFPIALNMQWEVIGNSSEEANAAIGESVLTMIGTDNSFNELAKRMKYVSSTPEYPVEGSGIVSLTVIFNIYYATREGDPFTAVN